MTVADPPAVPDLFGTDLGSALMLHVMAVVSLLPSVGRPLAPGERSSASDLIDGNTLYVLRAGVPGSGLPQDVIPINTAINTIGKPIETGLQPTAIAITTGHQQR
jgi:hypothetical protein